MVHNCLYDVVYGRSVCLLAAHNSDITNPSASKYKTVSTGISETRIKRYMKKENFIIKKCKRSVSPIVCKESFYSVKESVIYQRK